MYDQRPGMMDNEFQKHFRFFPKVLYAYFSSTAEHLAVRVIDIQERQGRRSVKQAQKIWVLFDLRRNKFYENGPPTVCPAQTKYEHA